MEGFAERPENSTDHTILNNNGQETKEVDEFNAGNAARSAVMQMPQDELEEFTGWFLVFACQRGIVQTQEVADGNISNIKRNVVERFKQLEQAEEMCVILEAQMVGIQTHSEELLVQKDDDEQQELE